MMDEWEKRKEKLISEAVKEIQSTYKSKGMVVFKECLKKICLISCPRDLVVEEAHL